jgi:trans-aconitate 2-methyltransferase
MPTWNTEQYLRFVNERTRPCRDLVTAIAVEAPRRIVDLGCGPGNSTAVLAARWPAAEITGLDNSEAMITEARRNAPNVTWLTEDIGAWTSDTPYPIVFSNAALQWVPHHEVLYPRLLGLTAPGGAFAAQVPCNFRAEAHEAMRAMAALPVWQSYFKGGVGEWHVHPPSFYYDVMAPHATRLDIWETEYLHVMAGPWAIVEWYKGTGLRPFLDRLPDESVRNRFLAEYLEAVTAAYPAQPDGRVLFPFRRMFIIAYR